MASMNMSIDSFLGTASEPGTLMDLFSRIASIPDGDGRLVVVIDEYPYLRGQCKGCDSLLQIFMDHDLQRMDAFLIICGSVIAAMEEILGDDKAPLYKRFIGPMRIEPLGYRECRAFHPELCEEDLLRVYAIAGGIPLYHWLMVGRTFEECVKGSLLGRFAPLRSEAEDMIARELRPLDTCISIIRAINKGRANVSEIADMAGISAALCGQCLSRMEDVGAVESYQPMCGADARVRRYRISNGLIQLYYGGLAENYRILASDDTDTGYRVLLPYLQNLFGPMFEHECRQYIASHYTCKRIGSWWGRSMGESTDVDIVALAIKEDGDEYHILAECKFRNKMAGTREMEELMARRESMKGVINPRYIIFSRSGFTDDLIEYAERRNVELVSPEDMYRR